MKFFKSMKETSIEIAKDIPYEALKILAESIQDTQQILVNASGSKYKVESNLTKRFKLPKNMTFDNGLELGRCLEGLGNKTIYEPVHANHKGRHSATFGGQRKGKSWLNAKRFVRKVRKGYGGAYMDNSDGDIINDILKLLTKEELKRVILLDYTNKLYILPSIPKIVQRDEFTIDSINSMWLSFFVENFGIKDMFATYEFMLYVIKAVFQNPQYHLGHVKLMVESQSFREHVIHQIKDKDTRNYWIRYNSLDPDKQSNRSTKAFISRLNIVLNESRYQRLTLCQKPKIDHRKFLDNRNIVLIKCSNSMVSATKMIMSLQMMGFYNAFMSRDNISKDNRHQFHLFCDEPHTWISKNKGILEDIYSKAGKYGFYIHSIMQSVDQLKKENENLFSIIMDNEPDLFLFGASKPHERLNLSKDNEKLVSSLPKYEFLYKHGSYSALHCKSLELSKNKFKVNIFDYNRSYGKHKNRIADDFQFMKSKYMGMDIEKAKERAKEEEAKKNAKKKNKNKSNKGGRADWAKERVNM